jgi:hypothetical protein
MGSTASCDHLSTTYIEDIKETTSVKLWTNTIEKHICNDCKTTYYNPYRRLPTIILKYKTIGNITDHKWSEKTKVITGSNCDHEYFGVDESTEEYSSVPSNSLASLALTLATAGLITGDKHIICAQAECKVCATKFYVQCYYKVENNWDNYEVKSKEIREEWQIMKRKVKTGNDNFEYKIYYVGQ